MLIVGIGVHEDKIVTLLVEILHFLDGDIGSLHLRSGAHGVVDHLTRHNPLELEAHQCATLTRLVVPSFDDRIKVSIQQELRS